MPKGIRLVSGLRGDVGLDNSGLDPSSWALDLRSDGGGTQSMVEWWSFSRCIPGLATCRDLASGSRLDHYKNVSIFLYKIVLLGFVWL